MYSRSNKWTFIIQNSRYFTLLQSSFKSYDRKVEISKTAVSVTDIGLDIIYNYVDEITIQVLSL